MTIPIYKAEADAGLTEVIKANASIAYESVAKPFTPTNTLAKQIANLNHPELAKANENQWDLFWLDSILVSVGWNNNDDVFDPGETWAAKDSPVHKQFNFMHNEKDIIGHMTQSMVMSPDGKTLANEDTIPEKYDIVVASVLYKHWTDEELQERMDKIIAGIPKGEWFVSMECLFRNFDYALITPNGEHQVVARNQNTAFLTKHLRIYGGEGEFNGNKIGRLLRGFTFSGKGLVDNPANPRSIIFNDVNPFDRVTSSINIKNSSNTVEKKTMADEVILSKMKDDLAKAEARSEKLESKLDEMVAEARQAEKDRVEKEIASLKVDIEDLEKKVEASKADIKEKDEAIAKLEKELKDTKAKLDEANTKLEDSEAATVKAKRISVLVEAGVDSSKAEEVVEKWAGSSDEQFEEIVALHKSVVAGDGEDMKNGKKKKEVVDASEKDNNEANADSDLDDVDEEKDAALASAEANEDEDLQVAAASWIGGFLKSGKKTNQE